MDPFQDSEITTILTVKDIEKSKEFYLNKLEAEFLREYGGTSLVIKFLNHWILLVTEGGPTEDKPETSFKSITNKNEINHAFTIRVKDCQKSYEALVSKGIEFITPPYDWGYEVRCFFYDPDGHLFEMSEYKGS